MDAAQIPKDFENGPLFGILQLNGPVCKVLESWPVKFWNFGPSTVAASPGCIYPPSRVTDPLLLHSHSRAGTLAVALWLPHAVDHRRSLLPRSTAVSAKSGHSSSISGVLAPALAMDEYDNDGSGDAAAFGNDSAYGAPGAFGNDGGYGAAGTFGTDSDCAAPGGFGDASGYGTSPGYGAAGGTRDFLSQSAAYSGSAGYRAYGGPSSSSRTSSLLGMDALDLNAGDPWARSNAYEDTVGSGAEDGGNGSEYPTHPPCVCLHAAPGVPLACVRLAKVHAVEGGLHAPRRAA